jgi:hypothetical protein
MPEDQQQNDDRERNADQPQQNALTHDTLLSIVSILVQHPEKRAVPFAG